jgi:hypothetical protein
VASFSKAANDSSSLSRLHTGTVEWVDACTAFYNHPGYELIDFVAPTVMMKSGEKPTYSSVVVVHQVAFLFLSQ